MSAYLMDSAALSMLANATRGIGIPTSLVDNESAIYDKLLDENLKSVGYRYPNATRISDWCDDGEAAYIYDATAVPPNAAKAEDLCREYDYQSCEHPEYRESFAAKYVAVLRPLLAALAKEEREAARAAVVAALKPVDIDAKETAAIVRKLLRKAFPACKFSVVTERGAMVSSIRIGWTDGPSEKAVDAIVQQFKAGDFDGMTDSYTYDRDHFVQVDGVTYRPGCQYIFTNRAISPALAGRCIDQIAEYWGVETKPVAVASYNGFTLEGANNYDAIRPDLEAPYYSWYACIRRAAEDREAFTQQTA